MAEVYSNVRVGLIRPTARDRKRHGKELEEQAHCQVKESVHVEHGGWWDGQP